MQADSFHFIIPYFLKKSKGIMRKKQRKLQISMQLMKMRKQYLDNIINMCNNEKYILENPNLIIIDGKTVPENFTGKIRKEQPSHVILVDACLMGCKPGEFKIVDKDDFVNIGISTHSMSLSYFVKYLERDNDFKIIFVGIEPESMDYSDKPTPAVQKGAYKFINILKEIL